MLKTLSAMLDNFDTQMADYMADIDMQVQAFSSDPWLHDETKMEEDLPGLKPENFSQLKDDGRHQGDLTIEIDMEEHNSAEYDMVDDHQPPETLDVEVYDASLAHSPAMGSFDSVLPTESSFLPLEVPPTEPQESEVATAPEPTISADLVAAPFVPPVVTPVPEENPVSTLVFDWQQDGLHTSEASNSVLSTHEPPSYEAIESLENVGSDEPTPLVEPEYPPSTEASGTDVVAPPQEETTKHFGLPDHPSQSIVPPDDGPPGETEAILQVDSTSADPHEISEGVYIDPPPAVLLTISSDDHEFEFSLFNEPADWRLPSTEHHVDVHRILLHHLPTMYYESLYSLFEALRQDAFIQSTFHLPEVELVLHAVDLSLTISEDNIYSRDVSLHDLNTLHDGSAIGGPLRTKLYASSPRFIIQYQQLQEHASRLQLGHQSRGAPLGAQTETNDNQLSSFSHTSDQQEVLVEESELETHSTEPAANGGKYEELDESTETETPVPQQIPNSEQLLDLPQEAEHEDENEDGQATRNAEGDSLGDEEESPAESYPSIEGNDQDGRFGHSEEDAAVIGLDILEGEIIDEQRDDDEHDNGASATAYDESQQGDEIDPDNGLAEESFHEALPDGGSQSDEDDEVDQLDDGADEQGEEISHEHTEYAEPEAESEPLPDQFQIFPQDANHSEEDMKRLDSSSLSEKVNDPEYTEDEPLPELPTDPISFDDENWQQELQEFENADDTLNEGDENENSLSNHSSVTLSSRGSKRTYDEYDSGEEGYGEAEQPWVLPDSPDPKRTRTQ